MHARICISAMVVVAGAAGRSTAARADAQVEARTEGSAAVIRHLAFVALPTEISAAQLDVGTELRSMQDGVVAESSLALGVGRGVALALAATMREQAMRGQTERSGTFDGGLSYRWRKAQHISSVALGYRHVIGGQAGDAVRGDAAVRTTGPTWAAASLAVEVGDQLDGAVALAVGAGRGPVVPAIEVKLGRCVQACALGAMGARVRLPGTFELGLSLVGEALPRRDVGISISVAWSSGVSGRDDDVE
jgi:hypothetical protein